MRQIKIRQSKRIIRQSTSGGLVLVKRQLLVYTPFKDSFSELFKKRFGLSYLSLWLMMVFRALLGGSSFQQFEKDWNEDKTWKIIANYKKNILHRLLARNIHRISPQMSRKMVIGTVKKLHQKGLVLGKRVAIDSSPITVKGKKYEKSGAVTKNGKYSIGYKLSVAFDLDSKVPLAYILTSINIHDSQMLIPLIKMIQSEYNNSLQSVMIDRGYYGAGFFKFLDDQNILFYIPGKKYSKLSKQIESLQFNDFKENKSKKYFFKDGTTVLANYGSIRCIFITYRKFEEWMPEEEKNNKIWILFTNDKKISSKKAVLAYKDRWQIEIFFKQCKNELGLQILPGRDFRIVSMHVSSVLLAYIGLISLVLEEQQKNEAIPIAIKNWKNKFIKVILSIVLERDRIYFEFEEVWIYSWSIMEKELNGGILM